MNRIYVLSLFLLLAACTTGDPLRQAENPDPNHTHTDFAVYMNGQKMDFSSDQFMSGAIEEDSHTDDSHKHAYLHLHDNIGHVLHRHKPGLTLGEFFESLQIDMTEDCFNDFCSTEAKRWTMIVNGQHGPLNPTYQFEDLDQILLTYGSTEEQITAQWNAMTDDSCLYSRTCPQRGDPPAENCIADPAVPCVAPLDDL
jgi:hypothetical protein